MEQITGIHHVTAIAGDPQKNLDFYSGILGLRLVKLTVNYDDPGTYHIYYGDYSGNPGTILTFFPWKGMPRGRAGAGQATATSFSVPAGSLGHWTSRLRDNGIEPISTLNRFEEDAIGFQDYDGMAIELVAAKLPDLRPGWPGGPVPDELAIRGFHSATLATGRFEDSSKLLTGTMGFRKTAQDGNRHRFETASGGAHSIVDLMEAEAPHGRQGAGSVHHIAWRVATDEGQKDWREKLVSQGLGVSPVMDRKYFHSIYYREPSGILFEIATDPPGFLVDEPLELLGQKLVLPPWLEPSRKELVGILPRLELPELQHASLYS